MLAWVDDTRTLDLKRPDRDEVRLDMGKDDALCSPNLTD